MSKLTDFHPSLAKDFFQKGHWEKLPRLWQHYLPLLTTGELSFLLDRTPHPIRCKEVPPLSLLCFKTCCDVYSLDRRCKRDVPDHLSQIFTRKQNRNTERSKNSDSKRNIKLLPEDSDGQLHAFFRKHVKPKKRHEIQQLAQVIDALSEHLDCSSVVDVGSGLGHLARLLCFGYGLNVTSVEAADTHAPKATKYDREIDREIQKKLESQEGCARADHIRFPQHVTSMIYPNMTTQEFLDTICSSESVKDTTCMFNADYSQLGDSSDLSSVCERNFGKTEESAINFPERHKRGCQVISDSDTDRKCLKLECQSCVQKAEEKITHLNGLNGNCDMSEFNDSDLLCQTVQERAHNHTDHFENISDSEEIGNKVHRDNSERIIKVIDIRETEDLNCDETSLMKEDSEKLHSSGNVQGLETGKVQGLQTGNIQGLETSGSSVMLKTIHCAQKSSKDYLCNRESVLPTTALPHQYELKSRGKKYCDTGLNDGDVERKDNQSDISEKPPQQFILTGLHACGDLTPTFLRFFVNCDAAVGLASVGCCYMKLSDESSDGSEMKGYPMSRCVKDLPGHQLSYSTRELACHFADTYSQRLKDGPTHLKIHSFRAALEWLANQLCSNFQRSAVQIPSKKTNSMDFRSYVRLGLQKLGIDSDMLSDDLLSQAEEMTKQWKNVVIFYTIRLSLAPVVETLLLLDRMFFLQENDFSSALCPVFDPAVSPRNFVLLSWKDHIKCV